MDLREFFSQNLGHSQIKSSSHSNYILRVQRRNGSFENWKSPTYWKQKTGFSQTWLGIAWIVFDITKSWGKLSHSHLFFSFPVVCVHLNIHFRIIVLLFFHPCCFFLFRYLNLNFRRDIVHNFLIKFRFY